MLTKKFWKLLESFAPIKNIQKFHEPHPVDTSRHVQAIPQLLSFKWVWAGLLQCQPFSSTESHAVEAKLIGREAIWSGFAEEKKVQKAYPTSTHHRPLHWETHQGLSASQKTILAIHSWVPLAFHRFSLVSAKSLKLLSRMHLAWCTAAQVNVCCLFEQAAWMRMQIFTNLSYWSPRDCSPPKAPGFGSPCRLEVRFSNRNLSGGFC